MKTISIFRVNLLGDMQDRKARFAHLALVLREYTSQLVRSYVLRNYLRQTYYDPQTGIVMHPRCGLLHSKTRGYVVN